MVAERLDVRLDREQRDKLTRILESRGASLSAIVRAWIDQEYADLDREERLNTLRCLTALQIEDVPDPETLRRQLDKTYDSDPLP